MPIFVRVFSLFLYLQFMLRIVSNHNVIKIAQSSTDSISRNQGGSNYSVILDRMTECSIEQTGMHGGNITVHLINCNPVGSPFFTYSPNRFVSGQKKR